MVRLALICTPASTAAAPKPNALVPKVHPSARFDDQLASSGTLTPQEHEQYIAFTLEAARRLYAGNPFARDVVIFQNWLRPAGASFDHLHKQLVAIDELGASRIKDIRSVAAHPDVLQDYRRLLRAEHLVIAQTESADLVAGVGHHYPQSSGP